MNIPPNSTVIQWCWLCNAAPADGVLKIILTGEYVTTDIWACNDCVKEIKDEDWLEGTRP
jgi:hypothetical protein